MGIHEHYLAFCFDEAIEYIISMTDYDKDGKMFWKIKPMWNDVEEEKPVNNSLLISEMLENLKKYK